MKQQAREYRQSRRAQSAAETRARIIEVAIGQLISREYDEVSLADLARGADVTVQTVLRLFGSKEGLAAAAVEVGTDEVRRQRFSAEPGDVDTAMRLLSEHYETWGPRVLLFLSQEKRLAPMRALVAQGRRVHHEWVDTVFGPALMKAGPRRSLLRAQLIAATDVGVWKVLRHDLTLSAANTHAALRGLVEGLLP